MPPTSTIFLAGGGTGGHIFPNLAVWEALQEPTAPAVAPHTSLSPHFLLSARPVDAAIAAEHALPFTALPAQPFGLAPRTLLRFLWHWGDSVRRARRLLHDAKSKGPTLLLTTGGFVSAPCVQAARVERVPTIMVNLDAVPGRANRWAAKHAARVFTAAPITAGPGATWTAIPPIVRAAALPPGDRAHCRRALGLDPERPTLLVTGASLGARSINQMLIRLLAADRVAFQGWQVLHQTGPSDTAECEKAYADAGVRALVRPFVTTMGLWWGAADLAVGRCGAGIVAEAWAARVPALFMPYPYHKDQHQRANALPLERAGAAHIHRDHIDPATNASDAGTRLLALLADTSARAAMRKACASLGPADGAARVAAAARALLGASPR
jgi:UDP-N-acetylglucosamine:LPS N-acetylglucosamine transferase